MARKLQIKRGKAVNLPTLAQGELAMTTDAGAEKVHIGTGDDNLTLAMERDTIIVGEEAVLGGTTTLNKTDGSLLLGLDPATGVTVAYPTGDSNAANKKYVDDKLNFLTAADIQSICV